MDAAITLYLLLLAAACQGLAIRKVEKVGKPSLLVVTALEPPALQVEWAAARSADEDEPVIGYKVKVWEIQPVEIVKSEVVDGVKKMVKELVSPQINDAAILPEEDAKEIIVPGPLAYKARIPNIKRNVIYEIRVRAFTGKRDGPLSHQMRVQLLDDGKSREENYKQEYNFV